MQVEQAGVPVAVLGPSNLFGDWGVINAEKRTASLSCVTECEVLVIHSYNFLRTVDARVLSSLREKQRLVKGGMPMPAATQLVEDKLRRPRTTQQVLELFTGGEPNPVARALRIETPGSHGV